MSETETLWLFPECAPPEAERPDEVPFMVTVLSDFYAWVLSGACKIRDKRGRVVPLSPNQAQIDTHRAMLSQAWRLRPMRLIRLKSRKVGVSTWMQALFYYLTKHIENSSALTVAHSREANAEIFEIAARMLHHDSTALDADRTSRREIAYPIEHGSKFKTESAAGEYIGSGSTTFFLHMSELSKWPEALVKDQMLSLLNSVPDEPNTIVVIESTANQSDQSGTFERWWKDAEAGKSDYLAVFTPWFGDPGARVEGAVLEGGRSDYEQSLVDRYGVDDEQLAWLRQTLKNKCGGDELRRRQEYPSNPDEAFQTRGGRVYPMLSRERHERVIEASELRSGGWELYRGIDWGGAHPFVCLWLAHREGPSGFSIDLLRCINTWDQLSRYQYLPTGRPTKVGDDACDALRYIVSTFGLTGHVHVYRELYIPDSAQKGLDELQLCQTVKAMSEGERIVATVADRSRPNSINLFSAHGVACIPHSKPRGSEKGEIEDGIAVVNSLMAGVVSITPTQREADPTLTAIDEYLKRQFDYAIDPTLRLAMEAAGMNDGPRDLHPILGECG